MIFAEKLFYRTNWKIVNGGEKQPSMPPTAIVGVSRMQNSLKNVPIFFADVLLGIGQCDSGQVLTKFSSMGLHKHPDFLLTIHFHVLEMSENVDIMSK